MANVNVVVEIYGEDDFYLDSLFLLTINGSPIAVTLTDFGWTTATLVYAEGAALAIVVTNNPQYYQDKTVNTTAVEGTETIQINLVNLTVFSTWVVNVRSIVSSIWSVGVLPTTLGRPIFKVDNNTWTDIARLDDVSANDIIRVDGIFLADGTFCIDVRSKNIGIPWQVTITA